MRSIDRSGSRHFPYWDSQREVGWLVGGVWQNTEKEVATGGDQCRCLRFVFSNMFADCNEMIYSILFDRSFLLLMSESIVPKSRIGSRRQNRSGSTGRTPPRYINVPRYNICHRTIGGLRSIDLTDLCQIYDSAAARAVRPPPRCGGNGARKRGGRWRWCA
jgi:hypothetical protein